MSRLSGILRLLGFLKVQCTSWGGERGGASSRQGSHLGDFHGFVYFHLVLDLGPGLGCQNSLAGGHTCGPPPLLSWSHTSAACWNPLRLCCPQRSFQFQSFTGNLRSSGWRSHQRCCISGNPSVSLVRFILGSPLPCDPCFVSFSFSTWCLGATRA